MAGAAGGGGDGAEEEEDAEGLEEDEDISAVPHGLVDERGDDRPHRTPPMRTRAATGPGGIGVIKP